MRKTSALIWAFTAWAALASCGCAGDGSDMENSGSGGTTATGGATHSGSDEYAQARQQCVDAINAYRKKIGRPPYARWTEAEACVDQHAEYDSTHSPHAGFQAKICQPSAWAENECPGQYYQTVDSITGRCFEAMWNEGPGGGHYENMSSTRYTQVACGFFRTPSGGLWATQDFR